MKNLTINKAFMYIKLFQTCLYVSKSFVDALFALNLLDGNLDILRPKLSLLCCSLIFHRKV